MPLLTQQDGVKLLEHYGVVPADAAPVFELFIVAYSAQDRFYHNPEHLSELFQVASVHAGNTDDAEVVPLAIWFHDAVYEPRPHDNEMRSAELVVDLPDPIGVPASVTEKVVRLIRPPSHHRLSDQPADQDTVTLLDVDLAILGAYPHRYQGYIAEHPPGICLAASQRVSQGPHQCAVAVLGWPESTTIRSLSNTTKTVPETTGSFELHQLDNSMIGF